MSSLNALKYKIVVHSSYYASGVTFLVYLSVMGLSLTLVPLTPLSSLFYLTLFFIAVYASKKSFLGQGKLLLSESGLVERIVKGKSANRKIGRFSFYNGFFIFLQLDAINTIFIKENSKQFIIIYRDAISDEQYRLLARLINSGQSYTNSTK